MFHPRLRLTALAAAVITTIGAGCAEILIAPPPAPESPVFEVEYRNYAWGAVWRGFYVDREGRVYSYDMGSSHDSALGDSVLTPAQIEEKYGHARTLVKTLPAGQAEEMYARVGAAVGGPFTEQKSTCADAGGQQYSAWIFRASDGRYHRLLLHLRGDVSQANQSAAARELFHWLQDVTDTGQQFCDAFPD